MAYEIKNVSRQAIYEDLETYDQEGKRDTLRLAVREKTILTDAQFQSRRVQRHLNSRPKRLRARKL